jgi:hypothetical protein
MPNTILITVGDGAEPSLIRLFAYWQITDEISQHFPC